MTIPVNSVTNTGQPAVAQAANAGANQTLSQADFLKLLTAQLSNQDPTAPVDNSQLVSQLAQLSTVTGINTLNASVTGIASQLSNNRIATATSLIGKSVLVPGGVAAPAADGSVSGAIDVPAAADHVLVNIADANRQPIRTLDLGPQPAGLVGFRWDGTDAAGRAAHGTSFAITASTLTKGTQAAATTNVYGLVDGVNLSAGAAAPSLNVEGPGSVGLDAVRQIAG